MQLRRIASLCAPLMFIASTALAQKFTGVIEQQVIEIFNETVMQMGGEFSEQPTPEQEAYGFDPQKLMKLSSVEALEAANELDGAYEETTNTFYVNDFAVRVDLQTPMDMSNVVSYIVRRNQSTAFVILHAQKKYVELTASATPALAGGEKASKSEYSANSGDDTGMRFQKTGSRSIINEIECERYFAKDSQSMREAWVSADFDYLRTAFDLLRNQMIGGVGNTGPADDGDLWESIPAGMPIVVKELVPGGSLMIEEIKSIKRQPVDAKLFEIPSGYKKMTMTEMMKMQMELGETSN